MISNDSPRVIGTGTALPANYVDQEQLSSRLRVLWERRYADTRRFDKLQGALGITGRHLALPIEEYVPLDTFAKTNDAWLRVAPEVGTAAAEIALERAGLKPRDVDHLFFVTVTGIAVPSIDTRVISALGMRKEIKRTPIFGLGCVAGAAGTARAADYVRAYPNEIAVLLSVELCSLTWQREDMSVANLVSSGLFGDGAAAVVVAGSEVNLAGPQVVATKSSFYPDTEYVMGWDVSEKGFRIVLSPDVPLMVKQHLREDVDTFLAEQGLRRGDIASWIIHTGGPKVLEAVSGALELPESALEASWESLRQVGNLSSASVLVVLEDFLARRRGEPGSYSLLSAMGPGFCSELVLLRW